MSGLLWYGLYLAVASAVLRVVISRKAQTRPVAVKGLVLVVAAAVTSLLTDCPWFGDLESAYYPAGSLIRSAPDQLYLTNCADGFVNVPIVALLFVPLARFDYSTAIGLFTIAGVFAILGAAWLATRLFAETPMQRWSVFTAFALNGPLWYSLREGNTTHLLLGALLMAWLFQMRGRGALAGAVLGAAAVIKAPLAVFGLYFLARGRWREAASMFGAALSIVVVSLLLYGPDLHRTWFDRCVTGTAGRVITGFNVQSVDGVLARAYGANAFSWDPIVVGGSFPAVRTMLIGLLAGAVGLALWQRRSSSPLNWMLEQSAVLLVALLIFPVSWTHYYLFLLVPIVLLLTDQIRLTSRRWGVVASVAIVVVSLPLVGLRTPDALLRLTFDRLLASTHFFGALALLMALLNARSSAAPGLPPSSANSTSALHHLHQRASQ